MIGSAPDSVPSTERHSAPGSAAQRPTLKSLSRDIESLSQRVEQFKVPDRDQEASVIDKCARAIDTLPKRRASSYNYNSDPTTDHEAVARVLDYLRQRYGLADPNVSAAALRQRVDELALERDALANRLSSVQNAANGGWSA